MYARGQQRDALVFHPLVRHLEDFVELPDAGSGQSGLGQFLREIAMLLMNLAAHDDSSGIARARELDNLFRRAFGVDRDAVRARLQDSEIGHAPFGPVAAKEHDALAGLDSL